jgi:transcription initiation factor TFIIE subunit alpha
VKNNPSESDKQKAAQSGSGLKIAGSDPNKKEDEGVGIMLVMDKDESTRRQERDAEADLKRQQNVLPAWHLKSTITGELTALGVKESARTENLMNGSSTQVSNDDILKGLGVIGGPSKQQQQQQPVINLVEDVKPTINRESDRTCFFLSFYLVFNFSFIISL